MLVSIIAAVDRRGLIGDETGLPWRLPKDLRRFRTLTWGKPIIMGRRTFELIGKPLPGRFNIILTQNPKYSARAVASPGRSRKPCPLPGSTSQGQGAMRSWSLAAARSTPRPSTGGTGFT